MAHGRVQGNPSGLTGFGGGGGLRRGRSSIVKAFPKAQAEDHRWLRDRATKPPTGHQYFCCGPQETLISRGMCWGMWVKGHVCPTVHSCSSLPFVASALTWTPQGQHFALSHSQKSKGEGLRFTDSLRPAFSQSTSKTKKAHQPHLSESASSSTHMSTHRRIPDREVTLNTLPRVI